MTGFETVAPLQDNTYTNGVNQVTGTLPENTGYTTGQSNSDKEVSNTPEVTDGFKSITAVTNGYSDDSNSTDVTNGFTDAGDVTGVTDGYTDDSNSTDITYGYTGVTEANTGTGIRNLLRV